MFDWNDFSVAGSRRFFRVAFSILLAAVSGVRADDFAAARFKGAPTYDFGVTNVKWEAATPEYSYVTFDLSWSYSWRAKWTEPAKTSATGKDMEVENWDAAWVFVKFLPEQDSKESIERNHWRHATLDTDSAHHVMPAGATNTVKLSDDGSRGMGVFIYRDAIGNGANNFKSVKLRWLHKADQVDPTQAAVRAYAIPMVYVPEGPFKLGVPAETGFAPFSDGPDIPKTRYDGEQNFMEIPEVLRTTIETTTSKDGGPYLRWTKANKPFQYTDGAWRGGKSIPFLLDQEWNGPVAEGTRGRRIGPVAGWFWGTHTFSERAGGATFGGPLGGAMALNNDYPTGYEAFYCMKYDVTQGQYCDYLNSLPPDVAAARAFVSSEEWSAYGQRTTTVKDKLPSGVEYDVVEKAGNTIRSSADAPATAQAAPAGSPEMGAETKKKDDMALLVEDAMTKKKNDGTKITKTESIPVYRARCPFRRLQGFCWDDIRAFAVWSGLRPMTGMEATKAGQGPKDPAAPPGPASSYDEAGELTMADEGQPTERPIKGLSLYGADFGVRVGCFSTPTSDQAVARATYWGITELGGMTVPLLDTKFRGSHGNGIMPAGNPSAPWKRGFVAFTNTPPDWGRWDEYSNRRHAVKICRLVLSAGNRILKPAGEQKAPAWHPKLAAQFPPADARRDDIPRVANIKVEPGKEYSTVSFDLAWKNSWRAKWEEPAAKNVTGKPLTVESWDAAWVIVKFRPTGAKDEGPALLATAKQDHQVPAGAELDVGLTDEGDRGVGVFIYRNTTGVGPNDFKSVKLRWAHPPSPGSSGATSGNVVDPTKGEVKVYAIAMVYVPDGPFASRSPWGHALKTITDPDATKPEGHLESGPETVPQSPEWPNGFSSFYCMKYSVAQGQYADFLNSIPSRAYNGGRYGVLAHNNARFYSARFHNFNGYTITTNAAGVFMADVPERWCPLLSLPDIQGFTAWAGLRPPTNLEYEKACRGPRAVARAADAWTPAMCAPAAGIDASALEAPSAAGPGPSYWGIRELSLSGCVQEWPAVFQNEPATKGQKGTCSGYGGTHGSGSPTIPDDWPYTFFGDWYYGGIWRCWGYGTVGHWINADEYDGMPWETMDGERCGRYGARAVRTAPVSVAANAMLQIDALPKLTGIDIGVFYLSGRLNNTSDNPLNVELSAPLSDVCFLDGAASRALTAAPKAVTPFKIAMAVTRQSMMTGGIRGGILLPVQLKGKDGQALETLLVPIQMGAPAGAPLPVISSIRGGEVALRITNATERAFALAVRLSPVGVTLAPTNTTVPVAAGAEAKVVFSAPRQAFTNEGPFRIPYGIAVATAAPQNGEAAVDLRTETRWWITKRVKNAPKAGAPDEGPGGGDDLGSALAGLGDLVSYDGGIFKTDKPPKDWTPLTFGASLAFGDAGKLSSQGSAMLAVTRIEAVSDREAVMAVQHATKERFDVTVWVNDAMVFKLGSDRKKEAKPFTLRKTGNTMMVECRSAETGAVTPGTLSLQFSGAKDGKPITGLLFDMEKR